MPDTSAAMLQAVRTPQPVTSAPITGETDERRPMPDGVAASPVVILSTSGTNGYRFHLARALHDLGQEVVFVEFGRRPVLHSFDPSSAQQMQMTQFVGWLRTFCRTRPDTIVLNSTHVSFPVFGLFLKIACCGRWCYDFYDNFASQTYGWTAWLGSWARQTFVYLWSDFTVRPSHASIEVMPRSLYLPSGSHVEPVLREQPDFSRILVLSSFDLRTDWGMLRELAGKLPEHRFDLLGRAGDEVAQRALDAISASVPNVDYLGPYRDEELDAILARYSVMFAPYRMHVPSTRCIDPNRFKHGLSSGLEIITTDVPHAHTLRDRLHIVETADAAAGVIERLATDPQSRRSIGHEAPRFGWSDVAIRFLELSQELRRNGRPAGRRLEDELGFDPELLKAVRRSIG